MNMEILVEVIQMLTVSNLSQISPSQDESPAVSPGCGGGGQPPLRLLRPRPRPALR